MFGADVVVIETPRLVDRQLDHLLGARRKPDFARRGALAPADDELDCGAHFLQFHAKV